MIDRLLDLVARVEAGLDFPDEDLPPADRPGRRRAGGPPGEVDRLLATDRYGHVLRDGLKTVILGEPTPGRAACSTASSGASAPW